MKPKELLKSVIAGILVTSLFFLALEITQRVRRYFKSERSTYWLFYGFVSKPKDYDLMIARIATKKTEKRQNPGFGKLYEIPVYEKEFPNGIKKHNPDAPINKGRVNPDKKALFTDGLHLTAGGNEVLSDIIYNGIIPVIQEGQAS